MRHSNLLMACLALMLVAPATAHADPWKDESGHGRADRIGTDRWDDRRHDTDPFAERFGDWRPGDRIPPFVPPRRAEGGIPAGHLPPPGECRVWLPDQPPGHQPPPHPC